MIRELRRVVLGVNTILSVGVDIIVEVMLCKRGLVLVQYENKRRLLARFQAATFLTLPSNHQFHPHGRP